MDFIKGAIIGMVAGTCIGVIKNDMICDAMQMGKKGIRKMKRKFGL